MRGRDWQKLREALREAGVEMPEMEITDEMRRQMAETEQRVTTTVDIRPVLSRKRDALMAHASQIQDSWFSQIPPEIAETVFGLEHFIRAKDSTGAPTPETDLFAGLRPSA
jgi:LmbE family N-acetylglucosaminyl deacetylase